jgi:hypothetical protein
MESGLKTEKPENPGHDRSLADTGRGASDEFIDLTGSPTATKQMRKRPRTGTISPEPWRSIAASWSVDNPYRLFGKDSLFRVLGNLLEGTHVPYAEFRRVLQANADRPVPQTLLRTIRTFLKHQGPARRGRPARDRAVELLRLYEARRLHARYLSWLKSRSKKPGGLQGWSCIRRADWWRDSPSERATRMVRRRMFQRQNISLRHVRNLISSKR